MPNPFPQELSYGWCVVKGNKLIFYIRDWMPEITVSGIRNRVTGASVQWKQDNNMLILTLPDRPDSLLPSVTVELEGSPVIEQSLMPQNGVMDLTAPKGTLVHGKDETEKGNISPGLAMENDMKTGHSLLVGFGLLSEWHNPADSIEWDISIPHGGTFEVFTNTQDRWCHGRPWRGGRTVEITFNGQVIRNELKETRFIGNFHKNAALSKIGEITAKPGETGKLRLRTLAVANEKAKGMHLSGVRLEEKK